MLRYLLSTARLLACICRRRSRIAAVRRRDGRCLDGWSTPAVYLSRYFGRFGTMPGWTAVVSCEIRRARHGRRRSGMHDVQGGVQICVAYRMRWCANVASRDSPRRYALGHFSHIMRHIWSVHCSHMRAHSPCRMLAARVMLSVAAINESYDA